MSKHWVSYVTPAKTFIDKVSIDGCEDVADFLKEIKKEFEISGPSSHLTLYEPDGTTEIKPTETIKSLKSGRDGNAPLVVKILSQPVSLEQQRYMGKCWILTINFNDWSVPDSIETLSNVKYIRGQLEFSESQFLHWQIAVQYFESTTFNVVREQFTKKAHIKPIKSLGDWDYVWKEKTSCEGTRFELGDNSDIINAISQKQTESIQNPFNGWDINTLQERLKSTATNLIFLKNESLECT
jgi:hypothetical protein